MTSRIVSYSDTRNTGPRGVLNTLHQHGSSGNDVDGVRPCKKSPMCSVRPKIKNGGLQYVINLGWGALLPNISTMCDSYAAVFNPTLLKLLVDWSSKTILSGSSVWTETLETYQFRSSAFLEAMKTGSHWATRHWQRELPRHANDMVQPICAGCPAHANRAVQCWMKRTALFW